MFWLKFLVPFGVSFMESFLREYNSPSPAGSSARADSSFTIVDSGSALGWQWVVVPKAQAKAFKAAHPGFYEIINFLKVIEKMQRKQPADFRVIQPLVMQVCEAVEAYDDSCEMFIRTQS